MQLGLQDFQLICLTFMLYLGQLLQGLQQPHFPLGIQWTLCVLSNIQNFNLYFEVYFRAIMNETCYSALL